jgi:hypothetical protein
MQHTGLIRDASANQWRLFSNVVPAPGTTVDFTNAIYDDLQLGNVVIAGKSLNWANASIEQTSSLDLSITGDGQVSIRSLDGTYQWTFAADGTTSFPNNTIDAGTNKIDLKSSDYAELWFSAVDGNWQSNPTWNQNAYLYVQNDGIGIQNVRGADGYGGATWNHTWEFGNDGSLQLPQGGTIAESTYLSATSIRLKPSGGTSTQYLEIAPTAVDGNHVHLMAGSGTELFLGDDNQYVKLANTGGVVINSNDGAGNTAQWTFGTNGITTLPTVLAGDTAIGTAFNTNPPGHTVTLKHNGGVSGGSGGELKFDYGNAQIKVVKDAGTTQTWTFGTDGTTQFPGSMILAPVSQSITMQSDQYSQLMWQNANVTVAPNMAINSNFYVAQNNATLDIGYRDGNSSPQFKSWYWNVDGNLKLPSGGYILNSDDSIYGGGDYSNVQVATYLQVGNISNVSVAGNVTATYFVGNGAFLTGIAASSSYSNVQTAAYLATATINTTGNITAGNLFTSGALYVANITTTGASGNISGANYITANVILTNGGWGNISQVANIQANAVLVSGNVTATYFLGNGALLTGIVAGSSSYSNVQVATYLPTYTGNVQADRITTQSISSNAINGSVDIVLGNIANVSATKTRIVSDSAYSYIQTGNGTAGSTGNIVFSPYLSPTQRVVIDTTSGSITASGNILSTGLSVFGNVRIGSLATPGALHTIIGNVDVSGAGTEYFNIGGNIMAIQASFGSINTTGNITAQNLIGNISITGNVTGTSANVTLQAGAYTSVFDNQGNVRLPTAYVTGNVTANYFVGNGALLTGIVAGSSYSNVQVATYLPTYSGVVAASNVFVSGNVTAQYFLGNGALLTGIASSYSNVQVATYLPTYTGNIANVRLGTSGILTFPDGTQQTTAAFGGGGNYGNANVAAFLPTYTGTTGITQIGTLVTLSVTGNATVGNLVGTEANTRIIANVYTTTFDIYGNVSFPGNIITPTGLYVGPTLATALPNTVAQFTANANAYAQINFENVSTGTDATADYIATANNGTDTTFFVDLGITNNNYDNASPNNSLGTAVFANDSYLYAQGNLATTTGGNLVIGTSTANKSVKIFAGGINSANIVATVSNTGVAVTGNVSATNFVGSGSLLSGVAIKTTGSWTVPTGNSTQSFTVPLSGTYQLWVDCNIPNGILAWNATATVTNNNVPVVGAQYAWVYSGGGTPVDFTSIPNQFVGTGNTIVRSSVSPSVTTNRFDFGINNTSGGNITVRYGYVSIS